MNSGVVNRMMICEGQMKEKAKAQLKLTSLKDWKNKN
jgi:hypothetical protein